jgi:hypothetical protein
MLHDLPRPMSRLRKSLTPVAIGLVLLAPLTPQPIFVGGAVVVGLLVAKIASSPQPAPA